MARQWPSRPHGASAELASRGRGAPIGSAAATGRGTLRLAANSENMLHAKIAFAAGAMAASLLGGIALGGYTTGGFNAREPVDVIANAASRVRSENSGEVAAVVGPVNHVCTGCDAKLYREDAWYPSDMVYDTDEEWAREERESARVVRAALDAVPAQERDDGFDAPEDLEPQRGVAAYEGTVVARLDE